jgi:hypothetical protein
MPGSQLLCLHHPVNPGPCDLLAHLFGTVPDDDVDIGSLKGMGSIQDMLQQRPAADLMEHLWQAGTHACSLAGRQDDDTQ